MNIVPVIRRIVGHPLNRGHKLSAFWRFARWQIAARIAPGEIVYHWIDDIVAVAAPGETGFTGNIYCGLVELPEMAYVLHVVAPGDTFIDVGANVGAYTLLACGVGGAVGRCFEPVPSTYERLIRNLGINDLLGTVRAFNLAVGERPGRLLLSTGMNCENHVMTAAEEDEPSVDTQIVTLDEHLADCTPTMLKIDVEGFETAVIHGARSVLQHPALHSLIVELNGSGVRYGYDDQALIDELRSYGFGAYAYDPFARRLNPMNVMSSWTGNALFVRDADRMERVAKDGRTYIVNGVRI